MVNLLLVPPRLPGAVRAFRELARPAEGVRPFVVRDRRHLVRRWRWSTRPTFVFAPTTLHRFRPVRGRVSQGRTIAKSRQAEILDAAGVPVPRWTVLHGPEPVDLEGFGPYVVVKPDLGMRSAGVKFKKRSRVRWKPLTSPLNGEPTGMLVQDFIYTGRWPVCFRVQTLFGEVLFSLSREADRARDPLDGRFAFKGGGRPPVSACGKGSRWSLQADDDVLDLARRTHACFPDVPLLGTDIVRDAETGELYVLEINPNGATWILGADMGVALGREYGFDLAAQFDGLRVAAHALAEHARAHAK